GEDVEDQVTSGDVPLRRIEQVAVFKALMPKIVDLWEEGEFDGADGVRVDPGGEGADRFVFAARPTEIVEREGPEVPSLALRPPQGHRRIEAAGQEDDRAFHQQDPGEPPRSVRDRPEADAAEPEKSVAGSCAGRGILALRDRRWWQRVRMTQRR